MSNLMAKTILAAFIVRSLCLGQSTVALADIPFSFTVGGKLMPAGHYVIKEYTGAVSLQSASGSAVMALTHNETRNAAGPAQLVFHRYGADTFLSRVWLRDNTGAALPQCKREKQLAKAMQRPASTAVALAR